MGGGGHSTHQGSGGSWEEAEGVTASPGGWGLGPPSAGCSWGRGTVAGVQREVVGEHQNSAGILAQDIGWPPGDIEPPAGGIGPPEDIGPPGDIEHLAGNIGPPADTEHPAVDIGSPGDTVPPVDIGPPESFGVQGPQERELTRGVSHYWWVQSEQGELGAVQGP